MTRAEHAALGKLNILTRELTIMASTCTANMAQELGAVPQPFDLVDAFMPEPQPCFVEPAVDLPLAGQVMVTALINAAAAHARNLADLGVTGLTEAVCTELLRAAFALPIRIIERRPDGTYSAPHRVN